MTPANQNETSSPHQSHPQSEHFLPRLDDRAFWTAGHHLGRSQITSFAIHGTLAALLILLPVLYQEVMPQPKVNAPWYSISVPQDVGAYFHSERSAVQAPHGGGSGGGHDKDTVTKGMLPAFGAIQIVPPHLVSNPNATLLVPPNLVGDESIKTAILQMPNWGDPTASTFTGSNGTGNGDGMGDKDGPGIGNRGRGPGSGDGDGGNTGGNHASNGAYAVSDPVCTFCPRPDYSDEARKAKFQGRVMLSVVVLPNGQAGRIEILNSPGLGLDQRAIEAVRGWRFKPAVGRDGKPVATVVTIEVLFQLF